MEEIDLRDLFNYFISKLLLVFIIVLACFSMGCLYTAFIQEPLYKSYTTIILTKEDNSTSMSINDINLNKGLVDTYRELILSKKIAKQVINNLGLNMSADDLIRNTSVESVNNTNMIKVSVVNSDANNAKVIANEIARIFNEEVINYFEISNVGVVDEAEIPTLPYNVNVVKQLVISLFIGIVLAFGIVFVIFYFDTTVKNGEEIEKKLNLSVIGYIPRAGGND